MHNPSEDQFIQLDITMLQPNPLQVRNLIKSESLVDLVESIKEHGILEPLVVAKTPAGYQIIAGERRWRAAKIAAFKTVPVIVRETSARGMLEMAIVENVQREDLNPIERAQGLQRLIDEFSLGVSEIAKRLGKSPAYVSNTLRLLSLPDAIKDGLVSEDITEGHARAIAGLGDTKLMVDAYKTILTEGASVRRAEDLARTIKEEQHIESKTLPKEKIVDSQLEALSKEVAKKLNATVRIKQTAFNGWFQIKFNGPPKETSDIIKHLTDHLMQWES